MRDYFLKYGVAMGKRYTPKQKEFFLNEIAKDFMELGYEVEKTVGGNKLKKITNLHIGDLHKAKFVFVVPYDTPAKVFLPKYRYYPFHTKKNVNNETLNLISNLLVAIVLLAVVYILLSNIKMVALGLKIVFAVFSFILAVTAYCLSKGIANSVNYNRNSASIVLIRSLADQLKGRRDAAFILADDSILSLGGIKQIKEYYGTEAENKKFILLDCLSYGETLVLAHKQQLNEEAEQIIEIVPDLHIYNKTYSDEKAETMALGVLPNVFYLVSGSIHNKEFTVYNTRTNKDYKLDMDRLERIKEMFLTLITQK